MAVVTSLKSLSASSIQFCEKLLP